MLLILSKNTEYWRGLFRWSAI